MKNQIKYILLLTLVIALTFTGCDDAIYPKGDLDNQYVLSCVLNGDTSYQVAFLTKTYDVDGFDPYSNDVNPSVDDAQVVLLYNGLTYYFRDTVVTTLEDSRYPGGKHYYYLNNFTPAPNQDAILEARMQDGTIINSEIRTFPYKLREGSFYRSDFLAPPENPLQNTLLFKWGDYAQTVYFIPVLSIEYSKTINGVEYRRSKLVPQMIENGEQLFPGLQTGDHISYNLDAFDYAFESIAEDGVAREDYKIYHAVFKVLITDEYLATYYSASNTFSDSFTILVTEPEYTNINGGLGMFGSFVSNKIQVTINRNYTEAYGYSVGE